MDPLKNNVKKLPNDDWRSEADFDLRYNRWLLTILGLWPPATKLDRILEPFFIFSTLFFLGIFVVPHGAYMLLIERDRDVRLKMIGPLSFCIMALGKYGFALLHKRAIISCVDCMTEDWKSVTVSDTADEKNFMTAAGHWCDNFTKLCVTFVYGGTTSYSVFIPLLEQVSIVVMSPGNATRTLTYPCHFGVKTYDISTDMGFIFEVLSATHAMSSFTMSTVCVGMCTLVAKFVMHACGQLEIMMKYLKLIVNDDEGDDVIDDRKSNFKLVVIKHLKILRFTNDVEQALTAVCFVEYIGCTFNICLCGYYFITEMEKNEVLNAITYMLLLMSFVTNIFIFCYLGERLTEQCQKIGSTTYAINWPRLLLKGNKIPDVELIIMISQHPPKLTAGKFFNLTMDSFTTVMKAAATYLNMLRKVTTVD